MSTALSNQQFNIGSTMAQSGAMPMSVKFDGPSPLNLEQTKADPK